MLTLCDSIMLLVLNNFMMTNSCDLRSAFKGAHFKTM